MLVEQGGRGDGMGLELSVPLTVALLLVFSGSVRWHSGNITFVSGTIPADRMKAGIQHRGPLSLQAVAVLENLQGLHDELVFPSPRKQIVLSDMVMITFLRIYFNRLLCSERFYCI